MTPPPGVRNYRITHMPSGFVTRRMFANSYMKEQTNALYGTFNNAETKKARDAICKLVYKDAEDSMKDEDWQKFKNEYPEFSWVDLEFTDISETRERVDRFGLK